MKWLALISLTVLGAGRTGDTPHDAPPGAPDTLTMSYTVAGLHVIQRVNRATDIVAARLYFLGGTRQLTEATAGIEALWLDATGYGTRRYPGAQALRAMARTGTSVQIEADADWSVFGFTGLAQDFDSAWAVLADRVTAPSLTNQAIGQARSGLVLTAHTRYTDPDQRIQVIASRAMFRDHPYALDPEGTEASVRGITPEQVRAYAREQIVTSRMLLVIVGNIERAHAESLVAATLGKLPEGTYQWTLPPPPPARPSRWLVEHREIPTNYILCYFTGPPPTEPDYWSFRVATALLSSEIYYTVRVNRSLSYAAYAPFIDRAVPIGGAYASTAQPEEVLPLIQNAVRNLEASEYDHFQLQRFLNGYVLEYLEDNATAADQADFLARAELYLGGFRRGDEFMKQLHRVSPPGVRDAANNYMRKLQYAYLGDTMRMRGHW